MEACGAVGESHEALGNCLKLAMEPLLRIAAFGLANLGARQTLRHHVSRCSRRP